MNLVDVLIIGVVLLGALHGYQKGLITSIVNFLSSIIAFVVASWKYAAVLHWSEQYLPLQKWLEPLIYQAILPAVQAKTSSLQQQFIGNILSALPPGWRNIFDSLNLANIQIPQTIEQVTQRLAETLTERILGLVAFGCVFLTVVILIQLLASIMLRFLGFWGGAFNRGGGLMFGGLSVLVCLAVLVGLSAPLLKMGVGGSFNTLILNSFFYPYLTKIFQALDQVFSAQISQKLLEPLSLSKGIWY